MSLIKQLIDKGFLTKDKAVALDFQIKQTGRREEDIILESGLVPEIVLFKMKSDNLGIPLKDIEPDRISLKDLEMIPEETARYYQMIPLQKRDKMLEIGMVFPDDIRAQEALKFLSRQQNYTYQIFLITPSSFRNVLRQYRSLKREVGLALEELESDLKEEKEEENLPEYERITEEAPVTKIVAVILKHAVEGLASDIHIEPTRDKLRVRFRLMGVLHSSIFLPMRIHPAIIARVKILSNLKIDETRIPQDGRFSIKLNEKTIDFRVSSFPTTLGEKVAIRVLDPSLGLGSFDQLGLDGRNLRVVQEAIKRPHGMVLSTGPTGSGKTTTLYAILQLLNKEGSNIVTLEDPVEYFIGGINQSQVRPEIGYDFALGLRHILRQDPNIIMVGEIRDEETASLAIHSALTGHIVLSTLHTNDAVGVVPRLVDMGIKSYLLPPTLQLVIAQRLVRKLCKDCREKIAPKPKIKEMIEKELDLLPQETKKEINIPKPLMIYTNKGCKKCNDTGYSTRIALFEILSMSEALADAILKDPSESNILKEAKAQGMITMKQDGIIKVIKGITTIEEVLRVAEEK